MTIFCAALLSTGASCKKEPPIVPPDPSAAFTLVAEDASCTEAWLHLQFETPNLAHRITLRRDSLVLFCKTILNDTMIVDEGLLPSRRYAYTASDSVKSLRYSASITTMDTTSHDIVWTTEMFGEGPFNTFNAVAIVNDTLAYAVGEIHCRDSTGKIAETPYNAARWNGRKWELFTPHDSGFGYSELHSVCAFGPDDIWFGGSSPMHWDGKKWKIHGGAQGYTGGFWIYALWGTSSNDLYAAGGGGNIRHFNGTSWKDIPSGTDVTIRDIWGAMDFKNKKWEVLGVAASCDLDQKKELFQLDNDHAIKLLGDGLPWGLYSIWFIPSRKYVVVGDGLYFAPTSNPVRWDGSVNVVTRYVSTKVRGSALNDIFVTGVYGEALHFNGVSWRSFRNSTAFQQGDYVGLAVAKKMVMIVGLDNHNAAITIGRR